MHVMAIWMPVKVSRLSREKRMKALSLLMFLKGKQTGDVKGCACINKVPRWAYIPKEEAASPTVSTKSTFITQKVRRYNLPSAFVNTDVDKEILMVLKGELAELMVQIMPEVYREYVTTNLKGTRVLYI